MKKWLCMTLIGLIALGVLPQAASASLPYRTAYYDSNQADWFLIQPIYSPAGAYSAEFGEPVDLHVASDDRIYVADKKQNRIAVLGQDGSLLLTIGDEEGPGLLSSPEGVFVTSDHEAYVADSGNHRVAVFDRSATFLREFKKPDSKVLTEDYHFLPTKLVVDRRGVMYTVVKDSFLGLLRISPDGKFTGFFGANKAKLSWLDRLKRSLLNEQQMAQEIAKQPNPIQNVALSEDGFLLTTSSGLASDGQIKKLNAGGFDAFHNKAFREPHLVDTAIDDNGFMYGLNRDNNSSISVYDPTGEVMFYFGATMKSARQLGITDYGISLDINRNNDLWVVDNASNLIHIFKRTSFGDTYMTAAHLYFEGDYEKSRFY